MQSNDECCIWMSLVLTGNYADIVFFMHRMFPAIDYIKRFELDEESH